MRGQIKQWLTDFRPPHPDPLGFGFLRHPTSSIPGVVPVGQGINGTAVSTHAHESHTSSMLAVRGPGDW